MNSVSSLLKKEYLEHKTAFLYVPGILISLILLAFSVAVWRNGASLSLMSNMSNMNEVGISPGGIDIFNGLYAVSIIAWTAYLTLMLFFYFASSFSADRKNNGLLFWKSIPISDLNIMATKTLAGLLIFPAVIMAWSFVGAVAGFLALNLASLTTPFIGQLNSGTSFWTFLNVEISALVFVTITLLWYLPLFTFVGLLGTLLRSWAVPAFILIMAMISSIEAIVEIGVNGPVTQLLEQRMNAPFSFLEGIMPHGAPIGSISVDAIVSVGNFVPAFLVQVDWLGMIVGWIVAAVFVYGASEYRRRRLTA